MLEAIQSINFEKRKYLRKKTTQGTPILIDFNICSKNDHFLPVVKGIAINSSFGGCCILCITSEDIQENILCCLKIDDLDPIIAKIVWINKLDINIVKLGISYDFNADLSSIRLGYLLKNNRSIVEATSASSIFNGIETSTIELLLPHFYFKKLSPGEVLMKPGQENHKLYLLLLGTLHAYIASTDNLSVNVELGFTISAGECIGEMSILEKKPASAYVVADVDCEIIEIEETVFWEYLVTIPRFVRNLLQGLSNRMRRHNEIALEKQLKFELINRDLKAASKIQSNILPQMPLVVGHSRLDIFAKVIPAKEVGGDFFDCLKLDEEHICIAVGDVSGKGIPAALFMIRVITLLRLMISPIKPLNTVFKSINMHLCESNKDNMFVTMFVGIINVRSGKLVYVNGGHNQPFLRSSKDSFEPLSLPLGMLLGISENAKFGLSEITLNPNDTLVVYTDGVSEAENKNQEFFSTVRTAKVLNETTPDNGSHEIVEHLEKNILDFAGDVSQSDDITILTLRYLG